MEQNGVAYAECPYLDCDGGMLDFWWWDNFRLDHEAKDTLPEQPEKDVVYPLYPSASK